MSFGITRWSSEIYVLKVGINGEELLLGPWWGEDHCHCALCRPTLSNIHLRSEMHKIFTRYTVLFIISMRTQSHLQIYPPNLSPKLTPEARGPKKTCLVKHIALVRIRFSRTHRSLGIHSRRTHILRTGQRRAIHPSIGEVRCG